MKKILKLALIIGGIAAVAKLVGAKKSEWHGLTESEVRAKLDAKLPDRMSPEKQAMVADKVVTKMRSRGVLLDEEPAAAPESAEDETSDEANPAEQTEEADQVESS